MLRAPAERIYRAFLDADAKAKWLPPNGFTGRVHHIDARVGGSYKMSFTNFSSGKSHSFGGEYLELVPHERLRWTDRFDDPNLPGEMTVTVTLKPVSVGTEVTIVGTRRTVAHHMYGLGVPVWPSHANRSIEINDQALPILVHEALVAQSAQIDQVSGATYTSEAFTQSLQAALLQANAW